MVALPSAEVLETSARLAKRDTPKVGGSSAAFVIIIVALVLIIVVACAAIAILLREEAREGSEPSERGWRSWMATFFYGERKDASLPSDRRLSVLSQKGQGWIQAGQEGDWESKHLKITPATSPNSTIASRGKPTAGPQDSNAILPGNLFGFAGSIHDRPSVDITAQPSTTPADGDSSYSTHSPISPTAIQPASFEVFIPNVRSHLSASPSLSTVATHYTHGGSEAVFTVPPSPTAHESEDPTVARKAARGSKFIESL